MDNLKSYFHKAVHLLTPVEQKVMKFRFGIEGSPVYSLEDIALELKLAVEEVREVEASARAKLQQYRGQL